MKAIVGVWDDRGLSVFLDRLRMAGGFDVVPAGRAVGVKEIEGSGLVVMNLRPLPRHGRRHRHRRDGALTRRGEALRRRRRSRRPRRLPLGRGSAHRRRSFARPAAHAGTQGVPARLGLRRLGGRLPARRRGPLRPDAGARPRYRPAAAPKPPLRREPASEVGVLPGAPRSCRRHRNGEAAARQGAPPTTTSSTPTRPGPSRATSMSRPSPSSSTPIPAVSPHAPIRPRPTGSPSPATPSPPSAGSPPATAS